MIIDSWLITTDANGVPKSADALPALATSANIVAVEVVSAGVGVYSVRATLMDDALVASALLSWSVDSISYVQQMVFNGGSVAVDSLSAAAVSSVVEGIKADPPNVGLTSSTINSISSNISTKVSLAIGSTESNESLSTTLEVFQGEKIQQTVVALASDLTTPINLSGLTLELAFETKNRDLISVISSANITISGDNNNLVTFTYPDIVTSTTGIRYWTLRDADDASKVRLNGILNVVRASINTSV